MLVPFRIEDNKQSREKLFFYFIDLANFLLILQSYLNDVRRYMRRIFSHSVSSSPFSIVCRDMTRHLTHSNASQSLFYDLLCVALEVFFFSERRGWKPKSMVRAGVGFPPSPPSPLPPTLSFIATALSTSLVRQGNEILLAPSHLLHTHNIFSPLLSHFGASKYFAQPTCVRMRQRRL